MRYIYFILMIFILILLVLNKNLDRKLKRKPKRRGKTLHQLRQQEYRQYLKTNHWKKTRAEALRLGHYRCYDCGSTTHLQVHHLTYVRRGHERQSDLVVLCNKCHEKRHGIKH